MYMSKSYGELYVYLSGACHSSGHMERAMRKQPWTVSLRLPVAFPKPLEFGDHCFLRQLLHRYWYCRNFICPQLGSWEIPCSPINHHPYTWVFTGRSKITTGSGILDCLSRAIVMVDSRYDWIARNANQMLLFSRRLYSNRCVRLYCYQLVQKAWRTHSRASREYVLHVLAFFFDWWRLWPCLVPKKNYKFF